MPSTLASGLPPPDAASAAHSARCAEFIRARIDAAGGSISFAEFMQHALYAPGLGYYAAGAEKFGAAGDFVTAPEVSPLFASVLARQCQQVLDALGGGSILEFGAGSGRLAVGVLRKLEVLDALPEQYLILEVSADLQARQAQLLRAELPQLVERVHWIDALPDAHRGVMFANEVLDALPVERFVAGPQVEQCRVINAAGGFEFVREPAPPVLSSAVAAIERALGVSLPHGYTSEVSLAAGPWVTEMLAGLEAGVAFLFDYGLSRREYYAPDRDEGWLRCHFRHHAHNNPLILPGIQDITSWVDFSRVADAAHAASARIAGYVSQAHFLLAGGLTEEMSTMHSLPVAQQSELSAQVKKLTLPGEMGERFKCLGLSVGVDDAPSAFKLADRTHTL
tara:strand:+ start:4642 stop:5823 length:1182 start_codon:yes stop_codon:yes gene_type:complete